MGLAEELGQLKDRESALQTHFNQLEGQETQLTKTLKKEFGVSTAKEGIKLAETLKGDIQTLGKKIEKQMEKIGYHYKRVLGNILSHHRKRKI